MKMISSTSRMSIIGTTLGSDVSAPRASPPPPAMSVLLLLGRIEQAAGSGLRDGSHHPHPCLPRRLDRFLHLGVLELIVSLEIQNLVLGSAGETGPELVFQR